MEDFKYFIQGLDYKFFEHGVTGYRTPLGEHVYTASDDPPEVTMEPHNEVSYSPVFPKKVCRYNFLCDVWNGPFSNPTEALWKLFVFPHVL